MDKIEEEIAQTIRLIGNYAVSRKRSNAAVNGSDWKKEIWKSSVATKELLDGLCTLANKNNYLCRSSKSDKSNGGEWLFDLVWHIGAVGESLTEIILVGEIEWATWANSDKQRLHEIKYDFDKLLTSKTKYRLMVFEGSESFIEKAFVELIRTIDTFNGTSPGDRYLICAWCWDGQAFCTKHYVA